MKSSNLNIKLPAHLLICFIVFIGSFVAKSAEKSVITHEMNAKNFYLRVKALYTEQQVENEEGVLMSVQPIDFEVKAAGELRTLEDIELKIGDTKDRDLVDFVTHRYQTKAQRESAINILAADYIYIKISNSELMHGLYLHKYQSFPPVIDWNNTVKANKMRRAIEPIQDGKSLVVAGFNERKVNDLARLSKRFLFMDFEFQGHQLRVGYSPGLNSNGLKITLYLKRKKKGTDVWSEVSAISSVDYINSQVEIVSERLWYQLSGNKFVINSDAKGDINIKVNGQQVSNLKIQIYGLESEITKIFSKFKAELFLSSKNPVKNNFQSKEQESAVKWFKKLKLELEKPKYEDGNPAYVYPTHYFNDTIDLLSDFFRETLNGDSVDSRFENFKSKKWNEVEAELFKFFDSHWTKHQSDSRESDIKALSRRILYGVISSQEVDGKNRFEYIFYRGFYPTPASGSICKQMFL